MQINLDTSLIGIQRGQQIVRDAAGSIAGATKPGHSADLTESLIDLKRGKLQVQASAEALSVEGELIGTLLNIRA